MNTQKIANTNSNRITYIDSAKGLGIIFVVLAHLLGVLVYSDPKPLIKPLWQFLCAVTIAFFFLSSGFTMAVTKEHSKEFKIMVNKKFKSIMYPYCTFGFIYIIYKLISLYIFNNNKYSNKDIIEFIIDTVTLKGNSVLWFLSSLFLGTLFYSFLYRKIGRYVTIILLGILTVIIMIFSQHLNILHNYAFNNYKWYIIYDITTTLFRTITTAFCLNLGYELFNLINNIKISKALEIIFGLIMLVISIVLSHYTNVDFANNYFENPIISFICIIVGPVALMLIVKNVLDNKLLRYLGDKSLIIMLTHIDFQVLPYALTISYAINQYINHGKVYALYLSIFTIIIIFEAFWILIFDKFLRFLLKKT